LFLSVGKGERLLIMELKRYKLRLNGRPFEAIKAGTKRVEGRTPTEGDKTPYEEMRAGDGITFVNEASEEELETEVRFVHHYPSVREMLVEEGVEEVLSSEPKTVEHGVESYNSLAGYKKGIEEHGIYAIGVRLI
jgi:ASC-1-like (ASCH) protein